MSAPSHRVAHVPGAKVISYYVDADGQFGSPKIGYDVNLFEEAATRLVFGEPRRKAVQSEELNGLDTQKDPLHLDKQHIQFICSQLEASTERAAAALRSCGGSLEDALLRLIGG